MYRALEGFPPPNKSAAFGITPFSLLYSLALEAPRRRGTGSRCTPGANQQISQFGLVSGDTVEDVDTIGVGIKLVDAPQPLQTPDAIRGNFSRRRGGLNFFRPRSTFQAGSCQENG